MAKKIFKKNKHTVEYGPVDGVLQLQMGESKKVRLFSEWRGVGHLQVLPGCHQWLNLVCRKTDEVCDQKRARVWSVSQQMFCYRKPQVLLLKITMVSVVYLLRRIRRTAGKSPFVLLFGFLETFYLCPPKIAR